MPELALVRSTAVAMAMQLVFGMITLAVGALAIKWLDRLAFRHLDLEQEIAKGNLAAAVLAGTIWIALAMILGHGG
jgi:uncharacterized membrane protein YjfL (UPF0719 family)